MTEAVTTNAAVIAMRRASTRRKAVSGDTSCRPCESRDPSPQIFPLCESRRTAVLQTRGHGVWVSAQGRDDIVFVASHPFHRYRDLRAVADGLIEHAIKFGRVYQDTGRALRRL